MSDDVTLYHAWSGDPDAADDWLAAVQEHGLRTRAQQGARDDNPRNRYSYLYHPDMSPPQQYSGRAQRGFTDRPTVAVTVPAETVQVSELREDLREPRGHPTWQDRWADALMPYDAWREERDDRDYAAVEFVVEDGVAADRVTGTHPDGLPGYGGGSMGFAADVDLSVLDG